MELPLWTPGAWHASAIYLYPPRPFFLRPFYSSTSSCCRQKSVAGERMQRDCSSRGAWLREGRRVRERRRRCPLPTMVDQQRAEIELVQLCVLRSREEMRVSLRSRDAVRGAVGKYQPVFVIRRCRDGSASRVTGLRRCTIWRLAAKVHL